jgi:hypothetical protein
MEVKAKNNLERHLTGGKFYRVIDETDKEYTITNDSKIKYSYPKKAFEINSESQTRIVNPTKNHTTVNWTDNGASITSNNSGEYITPWAAPYVNPFPAGSDEGRKMAKEHLDREAKNYEEYVARMKLQKGTDLQKPLQEMRTLGLKGIKLNPVDQDIMDMLKLRNKGFSPVDDAINNGGSTDYYKMKPEWKDLQDLIEERKLSYSQGNVLKSAFTFNVGRHGGTDELREINKIIYFAERIKQEILKKK